MSHSQEQEHEEDAFDTIYDPEMKTNVPLNTAVGQQIVRNYLECLKNGADSKNIVSTKMFYKPKKTQTKSSQSGGKGSVRGRCGLCRKNVYSTQERVKVSGDYFHEQCYEGCDEN